MLKTIESELMSRRFLADLRINTTKAERLQLAGQMLALGEGFGTIGEWAAGDVLTIDWLPGRGTSIRLNNKPTGEILKDELLMQAIFRMLVGDAAYDTKLKRMLLGEKE